MGKSDESTSVQDLIDLVTKFNAERDFGKHHTPKNLSVSITVEAAELLELFQWNEYTDKDLDSVKLELSDILIYCMMLAKVLDIDVAKEFKAKLAIDAKKYPATKFKNKMNSFDDEYYKIKSDYRSKKQSK